VRAAIVIVGAWAVIAAAHPALADDTFEGRSVDAQYVKRVEDVVWPLVTACDRGDDTAQRQCRMIRDARAHQLIGATVLVDAEPEAFAIGAWNPQRKSVTVILQACIRCGGIELDGSTYYVIGSGAAPRFEGGRVRPAILHDAARSFSDENAAEAWRHAVRKARVQFLLKIGDKPRWQTQGRTGLTFDVVGYRVIAPCDGQVVLAQPAASAVEPDRKACRGEPAETEPPPDGSPVAELTESMVQATMKPVVDAAEVCHDQYGVSGKARLAITIAGNGTVLRAEQTGDFVDTPTGLCIDKAMRKVVFPQSKQSRTTIVYPIVLN
jgi:hypothetical protein